MIAETLTGPPISWFDLSPLLILLGAALVLLVVASLTPRWPRGLYAAFSATAAGATMVMGFVLWDDVTDQGARTLVGDAITLDAFSMFATIAIAVTVLLASLVTDDYLRREQMDGPEVYALYLTAAIGGITMAMANDLIVLFLGLEVLSISFYVLAASHRRRIESQEAGIKYFVLGGFSSAFFLYGIALIYGGTGHTRYDEIVGAVNGIVPTERKDALVLAGVALLLVGLAFKVSAVPFHMWTPDVYEGAPTPVTALFAVAPKIAAMSLLVSVLMGPFKPLFAQWQQIIVVASVLSMALGAFAALRQQNIKRLMAYSSIGNVGYVLLGVASGTEKGIQSVVFYLAIYMVMTLGVFATILMMKRRNVMVEQVSDLAGLARSQPMMALGMLIFMFSLAGIPPLAGFWGKLYIFMAAVEAKLFIPAVLGVLASVVASYYYLRIVKVMYFDEPAGEAIDRPAFGVNRAVALVAAFLIAVFSLAPQPLSSIATAAAKGLFP